MNRLAKLIDSLEVEDLRLVEKDLISGNIERLINKKILEKQKKNPNDVCPVCNSYIDEKKDIMLVFGKEAFRKKAFFCAYDCLEYFINTLRKEQDKVLRNKE